MAEVMDVLRFRLKTKSKPMVPLGYGTCGPGRDHPLRALKGRMRRVAHKPQPIIQTVTSLYMMT